MKIKHLIDVGAVFSRWEVLGISGRAKDGSVLWSCRCSCGTERLLDSHRLLSGKSKSCGCAWRVDGGYKARKTRTYKSWQNMKDRCTNRNNMFYGCYGGRGISVCKEWAESFDRFRDDMGDCPPGLTIERVNNNGSYSKANCIWADYTTQNRNTRRNIVVEWNGERHVLSEWATILGLPYAPLRHRIVTARWPADLAFTEPIKYGHKTWQEPWNKGLRKQFTGEGAQQ